MATSFQVVTLTNGEAQRLSMTKNLTLRLLQSGIWLTKSGDLNDYFLRAGDRLVLCAGESVVLESLQSEGQVPTSVALEGLGTTMEIDYNSALNAQAC